MYLSSDILYMCTCIWMLYTHVCMHVVSSLSLQFDITTPRNGVTGLGFIYKLRSRLTKQRPALATECVVSCREIGPRTVVSGFTCAPIRMRKLCRQCCSLIASHHLGSSPWLNGREAYILSSRCFPRSWIEKETSPGTATWDRSWRKTTWRFSQSW